MKLSASWSTLGKLVRQQSEIGELRDTPEALQPLAADTELALPRFDACAFAVTVGGLGHLHAAGWRASDTLWAELATHCTRSVATMSAQEISQTALGFAKAGRGTSLCDPALLDAIAEEAVQRALRDFKPQNLANMVWAYATAGHAAPALLDAIAKDAARRGLRDFKP